MKLLKYSLFNKSLLLCGKHFSTYRNVHEIRIPVAWGHLAGKWWGPTNRRPILTLHGLQDNCGSFDKLIPLLQQHDVGFLAIDFPGHGFSSRLPPGMFYYYTDYLILVEYVLNYFGWSKISLLGHSIGGMVSFIYAMINPQTVDFLICLDGLKPIIVPKNNEQMAKNIKKFFKFEKFNRNTNEPPSYTMEEIFKKLCVSSAYRCMIERNIAPSKLNPGKYFFTVDPRLKSGALANLSQNEMVEYAKCVKSPIFVAKATEGPYFEVKQNFHDVLNVLKKNNQDCEFHYVEGGHHLHLDNPEKLAELVNNFLKKYIKDDRYENGKQYENIFVQ